MADNVLGTVQIVITGDTSQLQASFAAAEAIAASAGKRVSDAFNSGFSSSSGLVDQYGRAIRAGIVEPAQAAVPALQAAGSAVRSTGVQFEQMGGAAQRMGFNVRYAIFGLKDLAEGRSTYALAEMVNVASRLAPAFLGIAAGAAVALIPFASAIIKTKELAAAEKELAEATARADEAFANTEKTLTDLIVKESTAAHGEAAGKNAEIESMRQRAARVRTQIEDAQDEINHIAAAGASSIKNYIPILSDQNAQTTVDKIKAQGQAVRDLKEQYRELLGQIEAAKTYDEPRAQALESGSLAAISAKGHEKTGTDAAEAALAAAKRQIAAAHDVRQARIDSEEDAGTREIESAAERTRVAQETASAEVTAVRAVTAARIEGINAVAAAEAQGKASPEQKKIEATQGIEVSAARREGLEKEKAAVADVYAVENKEGEAYANAQRGWAEQVARVWSEQFDTIAKRRREAFETANAPAAYNQLAVQGAQGVLDKGAGQQKELQIEGQKIALEAVYSQQIIKTGAARVAYLQQIAALDQAANTAKLTGLAADLRDAEVNATNLKGQEGYIAALKKVAELKVQIAGIGQQGINQQIQAQGQVTGAENANDPLYQVGTDIKNAFQKLPGELGSALANALFDHRKGDSTGKQVGEAFKNAGKQLVGSLLTTALKDLGEKIVAETGIQTLFNGIFQTGTAAQTVATTANTAAVVANTAAQAASAGAGAAGGIASAAGGVAGAAGSAGAAAATGGLSELAPIIGGVISGVISAVATVWGDAKIIQAIDATTAAVNGLRQFLASGSQGYSTSGEAGGPTTSEGTFANAEKSASDAGGALSQIPYVAGILGSFGLGNGMPVRIVGIDPGVISGFVLGNSLVGGLGGILGFDKGGPVPNDMIAQVHGGEWVLTKDQVAGRAPLPTELTGKGLSSAGLPSRLSLPSAQPSGSTPAGSGGHTFNGPMNFYGVQNVRQMMRQIADVAKSASPGFSPYSR